MQRTVGEFRKSLCFFLTLWKLKVVQQKACFANWDIFFFFFVQLSAVLCATAPPYSAHSAEQ